MPEAQIQASTDVGAGSQASEPSRTPDPPPAARKTRIIKRYANRKLYDTEESRYVTLAQVSALVKAGEDLVILDNRTKQDLTSVTLAQIIYEAQKTGGAERQGVKTLRDFIQAGGEKLMAHLREPARSDRKHPMVAPAMEALEELQRKADEGMHNVINRALVPLQGLQKELNRLQSRVEELESLLKHARGSRANGDLADSDPSEG